MLIPHNHPYWMSGMVLGPSTSSYPCQQVFPKDSEVVVAATNVDDPSLTVNEVIPVEIRRQPVFMLKPIYQTNPIFQVILLNR